MTPFISVVIDNYNYGRFLREAVDSVLGQDLGVGDVEVIVVDDGSTDDSRRILESYGSSIRAVLQPQQGQATAFNRGFSEARGEIVCLLDSDDLWRADKLSAAAPLFDDPAVGVVEHWLQDVDASLKPLPQSFPAWPPRYRLEDFLAGNARFTATSGLCYRRKVLEKALPLPQDLFYYLDDFLTVRALFYAEAANVPRVLGVHRVHGGNWCAGGYADARKLEVDFRTRAIFSEHLERWLSAAGKTLSPRFRDRERLEIFRRQVLYEALKARPAAAFEAWWKGIHDAKNSSFGLFRLCSLLLAVASPTLYLAAYSLYARAGRLKNMRLRLFPD